VEKITIDGKIYNYKKTSHLDGFWGHFRGNCSGLIINCLSTRKWEKCEKKCLEEYEEREKEIFELI